jgi:hypothetical protein
MEFNEKVVMRKSKKNQSIINELHIGDELNVYACNYDDEYYVIEDVAVSTKTHQELGNLSKKLSSFLLTSMDGGKRYKAIILSIVENKRLEVTIRIEEDPYHKGDNIIDRYTEGDFVYLDKNSNIKTIVRYIGESRKVVIPDDVSCIDYGAFASSNLSEIIIPDSVMEIKFEAFADNQLTSVTIPKFIKIIEDSTFEMNQLKSVIIPDGVTEIWHHAFANNQLTDVIIPKGVEKIDYDAFADNPIKNIIISRKFEKDITDIFNGIGNNIDNVNIEYID